MECDKISAEMTRRELEKLTALLKEKPELLHPHHRTESDDEGDEPPNEFESRNYYLTLELNNAMHENLELKNKLDGLKVKDELIKLIHQLICLNNEIDLTTLHNYKRASSIAGISLNMMELKTGYDKKIKKVNLLKTKLTGLPVIPDDTETTLLVNYHLNLLHKTEQRLHIYYTCNTDLLTTHIKHCQMFTLAKVVLLLCLLFLFMHLFNLQYQSFPPAHDLIAEF